MARMNYNPSGYVRGEGGGKAVEGDYDFKVDDMQEATFDSGNSGWKVTLLVGAFDTRDVKVFENLVNVESARWKIDQFLTALGFDFMNPPDTDEVIGRTGRAHFAPDKKTGYLKATEYFEPGKSGRPARGPAQTQRRAAPAKSYDYGPPPLTDDDAPF